MNIFCSHQRNSKHCKQILLYAKECFNNNILFAFICGSRASGKWTNTSDIDIFVVIEDHTPLSAEESFFQMFVDYHNKHIIKHEHCGEVFRRMTLDYLVNIAPKYLPITFSIRKSVCYSCIFSEFRKSRVVLGMLAGPKSFKCGNLNLLSTYAQRALQYFQLEAEIEETTNQTSYIEACPFKSGPHYQEQVQGLIASGNYSRTPVGIRLHEWFNPSTARLSPDIANVLHVEQQCILSVAQTLIR